MSCLVEALPPLAHMRFRSCRKPASVLGQLSDPRSSSGVIPVQGWKTEVPEYGRSFQHRKQTGPDNSVDFDIDVCVGCGHVLQERHGTAGPSDLVLQGEGPTTIDYVLCTVYYMIYTIYYILYSIHCILHALYHILYTKDCDYGV